MSSADQPTLSIIIPTLNESENLPACLAAIPFQKHPNQVEIILCDGGSHDNTLEIARNFPVTVIATSAGRAHQMNTGAHQARGEILLFLHADSILPENACDDIIHTHNRGFAMGCFDRVFDSNSRLLALTSRLAYWRVRKLFLAYGDQGIFVRRTVFDLLGGYRDLRRFEDLDLAVRAQKHGPWTVISGPLVTNARRFGKHPMTRIRRVFHDAVLTLGWLTGIIKQ